MITSILIIFNVCDLEDLTLLCAINLGGYLVSRLERDSYRQKGESLP